MTILVTMSYSTLRRSRTYIVVPRDVDPQNFIYVPETRKVRNVGFGRCFLIPLLVFLVVGGGLGCAGYFLHQYSSQEGLLEWPLVKSGEHLHCLPTCSRYLLLQCLYSAPHPITNWAGLAAN